MRKFTFILLITLSFIDHSVIAQDRIDELTKRQMDQADVANERQKGFKTLMGGFSTFLQNTHKEKTEKEEKDKEEKEKKEQKEEEKEQRLLQWMANIQNDKNQAVQRMANIQNDKNQAVPQRFITRGTSGENISTITSTSSSNK